ncbi:LacI family DNA-binding transcriptional regulator [Tetragenococcus koreensis]|uniref:LacI family DNA-binding transcriptional regulator n=1 Tax=Tetragenococcus koreensis TaxID=290335 RepID=UPI000F50BCD6|nr:LacI family DNA-binding transcriptional regulator [Tetragenococcus koreensis]AYW44831.1 LacI family transcriptional regulator [Tetragenococcus koreensis]GEN90402.1 LacI family transcriptional regulator [Tetragenococcus koreensis]
MATIKDVANKANLSVATVSRYLNDHPYISEDKKQRIKAAMEELDYTPSSIATQLRSKKGNMIGILVSRITNPFFSYLVDAIEKEAKKNHYNVLIMQTYDDKKSEMNMLELLKQQVIAGLIMCSVEGNPETIASYQEFGPIVLCNEQTSEALIPTVVTDQKQAVYDAMLYLADKGYQKIAYCTGGTLANEGHGRSRTEGFEQALLEKQLPIKRNWIFRQVHTSQDGTEVADKILHLPRLNRPDAVFTNSDEVAMGIMERMLQKKYQVPKDLAIMGFDNQPSTSLLTVPLTTIAQPVAALGSESTKLLLAKIKGMAYEADQAQLKLTLIKRKSA